MSKYFFIIICLLVASGRSEEIAPYNSEQLEELKIKAREKKYNGGAYESDLEVQKQLLSTKQKKKLLKEQQKNEHQDD